MLPSKNCALCTSTFLYLHWWYYDTSIEEVMQPLHRLVQEGKVLYLVRGLVTSLLDAKERRYVTDTPAWLVSRANECARCHALRLSMGLKFHVARLRA